MSSIKNVTLVGASGNLGSLVLNALRQSGQFNIKVLKRASSKATFPEDVQVASVDLTSLESLTEALKGQDAVVSTLGTLQVSDQKILIDASVAAGVKRFIPSEFGCDMGNQKARVLPVYSQKVAVQDYAIEKSTTTDLTYTLVYNCAFLDWGLENDFILKVSDYKPIIYDGGDIPFSSTSLSSVADAVVGVLKHPDETKNRGVYVEDIKITQNQLLSIAKQVAPEKPWTPVAVKLDDVTAAADKRLAQGLYDAETFIPYLFRAALDPAYGGNFEKNDNELLGIKTKTQADVAEIMKRYIK